MKQRLGGATASSLDSRADCLRFKSAQSRFIIYLLLRSSLPCAVSEPYSVFGDNANFSFGANNNLCKGFAKII